MTGRRAIASAALALVLPGSGCVSLLPSPLGGGTPVGATAPAVVVEPPPRHEDPPESAPPRPSLSHLTNRQRPHLNFCGATIYADSISAAEARGNVFLDGRELHQLNRSFPIAVYAERMEVDIRKERLFASGWPLVQTDSAFVQAQSQDTVVVLSRDRMARIRGPARYVIGNRESELFLP